ncbi:MAG: protein kinase [Verrucomicrobia bacterium]|nr:protein kinase [Verrucomicrobiota bacterium]
MTLTFRQIHAGLHQGHPLPPILLDLCPLTHWVGRNIKQLSLLFSSDPARRVYQNRIERACQFILDLAAEPLSAADTYSSNFHQRKLTILEKKGWEDFWSHYEFLTKTLTTVDEIAAWGSFPPIFKETLNLYFSMCRVFSVSATSIEKCQKVLERFKHYQAAEKHITPKHLNSLQPWISFFLPSQTDFHLFRLYVCREIKVVIEQGLTNRFVFCPAQAHRMPFYDFETRSTRYFLPPPLQIYYKKSSEPIPKMMELFVILQGSLIGTGGYKEVYVTLSLYFQKKFHLPLKVIGLQSVIAVIHGNGAIAQVKIGLKNQEAILKRLPAEKTRFFAPLPMLIGQTSSTTFQYLQSWFPGDLLTAAAEGKLPENISRTSFKPLKLKDFLAILLDVCEALIALHRLNGVHRDVKAKNILVYFDRRWRGVLADYDLCGKEGYYSDGCNYQYWSKCAQNGIISFESADGYGLIIALGEVFFLDHIRKFIEDRKLILQDEYNQLLVVFLKKHTLKFLSQMTPPKTSIMIDKVIELVGQLPDTPTGDKQLYDYLSQIMQHEKTKIYHPKIKQLLVELNMYKMIHSFIKTCIEFDTKIYNSVISDPDLKHFKSNLIVAPAFSFKIRKQLEDGKGGNMFAIHSIREKIKIMYNTLESGEAGKTSE